MPTRRITTFLVAAIVAVVGLSLHLSAGTAAAITPVNHVFVFMRENKSLDQMTGTPARDPYLLQTVKPQSAWFTNYNSLATGSLSQYEGKIRMSELNMTSGEARSMAAQLIRAADLLDFDGTER